MICWFNIQVWFWCLLTNVFILLLSLGFVFVLVCVCVCVRVCFSFVCAVWEFVFPQEETLYFSLLSHWWVSPGGLRRLRLKNRKCWWYYQGTDEETHIYCTQKPVYIKVSSNLSRNYAKCLWLCRYLRQNAPVGVTNVEEPVAGDFESIGSFPSRSLKQMAGKGRALFWKCCPDQQPHFPPKCRSACLPALTLQRLPPPRPEPPADSCCDQ